MSIVTIIQSGEDEITKIENYTGLQIDDSFKAEFNTLKNDSANQMVLTQKFLSLISVDILSDIIEFRRNN